MTSVLSDGNLRAFSTVGTDGLAGADLVCKGFADGRQLDGVWRAFLSVAGTAAPDRMIGAGPWVGLDGGTVFSNRTALTIGSVAAGGSITFENGEGQPTNRIFWTGTTTMGAPAPTSCLGWTSNAGSATAPSGQWSAGTLTWNQGTDNCDTPRRLMCLEQNDPMGSTSPRPTTRKRLFISQMTYNGNLGGKTGADTICENIATARNLGGTWAAILSANGVKAAGNTMTGEGPYTFLDGGVAFVNRPALEYGLTRTSGVSIPDELGVPQTNSVFWTGTSPLGLITSTACSSWTSSSSLQSGSTGRTGSAIGFQWDDGNPASCNSMLRVLCIER